MISIRYGTFETNSSSVHAVVIMSRDNYDKWMNEGLFLDIKGNTIYAHENSYIRNPPMMGRKEAVELFGKRSGVKDINPYTTSFLRYYIVPSNIHDAEILPIDADYRIGELDGEVIVELDYRD